MFRQIAPQFLTLAVAMTLADDKDNLGFDCVDVWRRNQVHATAG
jgi:hypothetical protein